VVLQDEHVELAGPGRRARPRRDPGLHHLRLPRLRAGRHYRARGAYVCLGGLHVTSLPDEAAQHADSIFIGPGEDIWPQFLADYRAHQPARRYISTVRTLETLPPIRATSSSAGCTWCPTPSSSRAAARTPCDFCYKEAFFEGGKSFYTQKVDAALAEIDRLPGRHLYFLDDHLLGDPRFANALFDGMRGMGRLWQAAGTVKSVLAPGLLEKAAACGLRSLFVGFESISQANLREHHKYQNLDRDYSAAIHRLHDQGVMVNGSFVFGMDQDDESVFAQTGGLGRGPGHRDRHLPRAHALPGHRPICAHGQAGPAAAQQLDLYDTRHVVFKPARLSPDALVDGYWRAYRDFYTWSNILRGASTKTSWLDGLRHAAYAGGWKKFEPLWDWVIRAKQGDAPAAAAGGNLGDVWEAAVSPRRARSSAGERGEHCQQYQSHHDPNGSARPPRRRGNARPSPRGE
jgi:hypothetical protein